MSFRLLRNAKKRRKQEKLSISRNPTLDMSNHPLIFWAAKATEDC